MGNFRYMESYSLALRAWLEDHLCYSMCYYFIPFYCWIILHGIYIHILLVHPSLYGHLDCVQFLTIMNNSAMNIHTQAFLWTFLSGRLLSKNIIIEMYGMFRLIFKILIFKMAVPDTFPPARHKGPSFSTTYQHLPLLVSLVISILVDV